VNPSCKRPLAPIAPEIVVMLGECTES
jgi:hypothetical protein